MAPTDVSEPSEDLKGKGKGKGRGKGKGKREGGKNKSKGGSRERDFDVEERIRSINPSAPIPSDLEGPWTDSLGNSIVVEAGAQRRGPLSATLKRGSKETTLSLRCDFSTANWACGNAVLDLQSSGPGCLVWVAADDRRSVWCRPGGVGGGGEEELGGRPLPDLLPWLLFPQMPPNQGDTTFLGPQGVRCHRSDSIPEVEEEEEEAAADTGGSSKKPAPEPGASAVVDCSRVSALLDVRQVFGNDRQAQEVFSSILMDHDLLRSDEEDAMVPGLDSPLWSRLADIPRRNALQRLGSFQASPASYMPEASPDFTELRCGRHRIPIASSDREALVRRWAGPKNDFPLRTSSMAHVVVLYRALENPLNPNYERCSYQLSWDPVDRKSAGIDYELFASPFNAGVKNGHYGSRFPTAEACFGSLGSYPSVIEKFPSDAIVGVNPPFTDGYLQHMLETTLDDLVKKVKRVHLTVPVREAPW
eukprot:CAMPEP_0206491096 /NCGR_PEP_ID=MMETSP0324_2-20121206/44666_1 /ASSEMBLY_ACC=CAM_ASM_000836 /TAXON_ID=2866 /ORGANISM="Crypthecodinium cohnii, Strain Seligo" /LENGTH=474 /DNA_ID=CAMNT_0053971969 /DNA_START=214 /DNA_END=1635 /DNA_ORIENTATION=-